MTELKLIYDQLGKGLEAIQEAEKLKAEKQQLITTLANRDSTIKGQADTINSQADTIRLSQEEQKALTLEVEQLNNTIRLLKAELEKPVPVAPVVPPAPKPEPPTTAIPDKNKVDYVDKPIKLTASMADARGEIRITGKRIKSLDSGVHCIDYSALNHSHKVIIEGNILYQKGMAVFGGYSGAELVYRNNIVFGHKVKITREEQKESWGYWALWCHAPRFASIENNHVEDIGGFKVEYPTNTAGCRGFNIRFNTAKNIWQGDKLMNFVNIKGTKGSAVPNMLVEWNMVVNLPTESNVEDVYNYYEIQGTDSSPLIMQHFFIDGAYRDIKAKQYSGGGVMVDGKNLPAEWTSKNIIIRKGQIIRTTNYCAAIAAGINCTIEELTCVVAAKFADGSQYQSWTSGIWTSDYSATKDVAYGNKVVNNLVGVEKYVDGVGRNDYFYQFNTKPHTVAKDNKSIPGPITRATEDAQYPIWQKKIADNNITLGPKL